MNDFPVYEEYEVIDGKTIFKDTDWWKAAVVYESYGNTEIGVYLWKNDDDGNWKRKQKYVVKSADDWQDEKQIIDSLVDELEH